MTKQSVLDLHSGDEVFWSDPDNGHCSRIYRIATIEVVDNVAKITDVSGDYLECFIEELA